jgi:hypothetical protein
MSINNGKSTVFRKRRFLKQLNRRRGVRIDTQLQEKRWESLVVCRVSSRSNPIGKAGLGPEKQFQPPDPTFSSGEINVIELLSPGIGTTNLR